MAGVQDAKCGVVVGELWELCMRRGEVERRRSIVYHKSCHISRCGGFLPRIQLEPTLQKQKLAAQLALPLSRITLNK